MTLPNCKCCKYEETKRCDYCISYSEFDYEEGSLSALENAELDCDGFYINKDEFKRGYLAGLKAGRPEWHDLRKDPNDLPKGISFLSKTVINQIGTPCHYNYALECWQNWSNTEIETPIAWCEIPTFTDKE